MKLWENGDFKIQIADIETLASFSLFKFYNPDNQEWKEFRISEFTNDLYSFVKFYKDGNTDYFVYFNGIDFDGVVIEFVIRNYEEWYNKTGAEICKIIYNFVQEHIDNRKHKIGAKYKEYQFSVPVLDVFTILGLDNQARMSSLKKCEFQLDWWNVEEMPIEHTKEGITEQEIELVSTYCSNDILATYELLKLVIGDTIHPIYKGNNQLELRKNIQEEFGIKCLNLSDIRLGDELMSYSYAKQTGKKQSDIPRKGTFRKEIKLKYCIPSYVKFETPELQKLLKDSKNTTVPQNQDYKYTLNYKNRVYTGGAGGLHVKNENEIYTSNDNYTIETWDVSSYYPALMVNNKIFPYHLGKELLEVYSKIYYKRLELKPLAKKDKKIKGITEGFKLLMNGTFGKLGMMDSWLYDKSAFMSVTLGGQLTLFMLIEKLEMNGISIISANSDGIEIKLPNEKRDKLQEIINWWQEATNFTLEGEKYQKIIYSTVNDYIAIKEDGSYKKKGDFISDFELWKNKSNRVIALALEAYFTKGIDPKEFISNHDNIYDYCIMARATGQLYLEEQWEENNEIKTQKHKKLVK